MSLTRPYGGQCVRKLDRKEMEYSVGGEGRHSYRAGGKSLMDKKDCQKVRERVL